MAAHGYNKFFGKGGLTGTAGWFDSMGMKPGMFHARIAATTEMAAGIGLAVGLLTPIPAAGFVALMLVAAWTVHRPNGFFIVKEGWEYNLMLAASAVASRRPGRASTASTTCCSGTSASTTTCTAGGAGHRAGARSGRRHRPAGHLLPPAGQGLTLPERSATSRTNCIPQGPRTRSSLAAMGFLKPDMPVVDFAEWSKGTRSEKIRPMARHWAEVGFGTPVVMHLFYVVKILLYILGGWLFALATKGIDGFTDVGDWWTEPIVFQKVVLYTMLFEVVGLGCGFGPLNNRFFPPLGSILYWLRPNTIRLPPWPSRIPLTKGDARTPSTCVLYAALLVVLVVALFSDGTGPIPRSAPPSACCRCGRSGPSSACWRWPACATR